MNHESRATTAAGHIDDLAACGRSYFATSEMRTGPGISEAAARQALSRLAKKQLIAGST